MLNNIDFGLLGPSSCEVLVQRKAIFCVCLGFGPQTIGIFGFALP